MVIDGGAEKKMRRSFTPFIALLLCACAILCACTQKKYDFSMEGGAYVDHRANIKYIANMAMIGNIKKKIAETTINDFFIMFFLF